VSVSGYDAGMADQGLSAAELREAAARYRDRATHYRALIEQEERPGGACIHKNWPETKAILLETAEWCERDAEAAMAEAAKRQH
jgi:hypothetical protein